MGPPGRRALQSLAHLRRQPGGRRGGTGQVLGEPDTYSGRFVELVPGELVAESIEFETDREDLRGEMSVRTTLRPAPGGTEVLIDHEGLPAGVDPADNETGTAMSLAKLAGLLEAPQIGFVRKTPTPPTSPDTARSQL